MTKLKYPKNGISSLCSENINNCSIELNATLQYTDYTVPSNFKYRTYMNDLPNLLSSYVKELNSILNKINTSDLNYETCEIEMTENSKSFQEYRIEERDRAIY